MHLVIDGYNLLHAVPEFAEAEARGRGREALLTALNLYRRKKRHRLTVVLDGGPQEGASRGGEQGIPLIFSGARASADDVIADLAAQKGPGITVITDDRELAGRCRSRGAAVIASWEFAGRLMDAALGAGQAAGDREDSGWDFTTKKKGPSRRLPKSRRGKARRLRRL